VKLARHRKTGFIYFLSHRETKKKLLPRNRRWTTREGQRSVWGGWGERRGHEIVVE
jgi:hypothetical protein